MDKKQEPTPQPTAKPVIGAASLWAPSPNLNPEYDPDRRGRRYRAWGGNQEDGTYWEE